MWPQPIILHLKIVLQEHVRMSVVSPTSRFAYKSIRLHWRRFAYMIWVVSPTHLYECKFTLWPTSCLSYDLSMDRCDLNGFSGLSAGPLGAEGRWGGIMAYSIYLKHACVGRYASLRCHCCSWWPSWRRSSLMEARCCCGSTFRRRSLRTVSVGRWWLSDLAAQT